MKKEKALERLSSLENEAKELRKIIETCDEPKKITDRVKSFEDACKVLGVTTCIPDFNGISCDSKKHYIADYKLRIIIKALNEEWIPNWKDSNENKYYPYFKMSDSLVSFYFVNYAWCNTICFVPSSLCLRNADLAEYAGRTFINEYTDLLKH